MECTGEAPRNAIVIIQCTGTGVVFINIYLVEYANQPVNITGSVSVPQYQQCNISIVFSNEAGSSEPFILAFSKYSVVLVFSIMLMYMYHSSNYHTDTTPAISNTPSPTNTPLLTDTTVTTSSSTG